MARFYLRTVDGRDHLDSIRIYAANIQEAKLKAQIVIGEVLLNERFNPYEKTVGVEVVDDENRLLSKIVIVGFDVIH